MISHRAAQNHVLMEENVHFRATHINAIVLLGILVSIAKTHLVTVIHAYMEHVAIMETHLTASVPKVIAVIRVKLPHVLEIHVIIKARFY